MTREQAEQRALELFPKVPIHSNHYVTNQMGRRAYLQCYDDMQKEMNELRGAAQTVVKEFSEYKSKAQGTDKAQAIFKLEETLSK